jgi:hypothetical protein
LFHASIRSLIFFVFDTSTTGSPAAGSSSTRSTQGISSVQGTQPPLVGSAMFR